MKKNYLYTFILFLFISLMSYGQVSLNACDALTDDQDFVLETVDTDATGRRVYETIPIDGDQPCSGLGTCEFKIFWNTVTSRWELIADSGNGNFSDNPFLLYYNTQASLPSPPDLTLGNWVENTTTTSGICMDINTLNGDVQESLTVADPIGYVFEDNTWTPGDPSGISTRRDNITVINGSTSLTTNTEARNIDINAGATLNVEAVLKLSGDIINNGQFILTATNSGNGEIDILPAGSTITGDIQVETFFQNKRAFRMVSSPVTTSTSIYDNWQESGTSPAGYGTHITGSVTGASGFDQTITGKPSMFTVNTVSQAFEAIPNTDTDILTAGNAYLLFVRGDRTIDLNASPAQAANTTKLRATGSIGRGRISQDDFGANAGEFGMFGNPYPSVVDMNQVLTNSSNLNTGRYYVYDASLASRGAFVTVFLPAGTNTSGSTANEYLQVGQAAQMATMADGAASITFRESNKVPGNNTTASKNASTGNLDDKHIIGQLFTLSNFESGNSVHDSFGIYFNTNYENKVTAIDAVKAFNFDENIAITNGEKTLSHDFRSDPLETETIPLYINNYRNLTYVLKLDMSPFEQQQVYLIDNLTAATTQLQSGENIYAFNVDLDDALSTAQDRFSILFEKNTLGLVEENTNPLISIFPNPVSGEYLNIEAKNAWSSMSVQVHNTLGQKIYGKIISLQNGIATIPVANLSKGIYLITMNSEGLEFTERFIKN